MGDNGGYDSILLPHPPPPPPPPPSFTFLFLLSHLGGTITSQLVRLAGHPDRTLVDFVQGIRRGFQIGHEWGMTVLRSSKNNHASAADKLKVGSKYIEEGSLDIHCSQFGVVPKKSNPNKWRLILDLSYPQG